MGMLQDYNGSTVSVITAVTLGGVITAERSPNRLLTLLPAVQPQIAIPGYSLTSLVTETQVSTVTAKGVALKLTETPLAGPLRRQLA